MVSDTFVDVGDPNDEMGDIAMSSGCTQSAVANCNADTNVGGAETPVFGCQGLAACLICNYRAKQSGFEGREKG